MMKMLLTNVLVLRLKENQEERGRLETLSKPYGLLSYISDSK